MPVPKVKNLILLILSVSVICLLLLVVPVRLEQTQAEQALHARLEELYAAHDIALSGDDLPASVRLYAIELTGREAGNLEAAKAILGENVVTEGDSTRFSTLYSSERGSCTIDLDGRMAASLSAGEEKRLHQREAEGLLKEMGFVLAAAPVVHQGEGNEACLDVEQALLGVPVFSEGLHLTYTGGRLSAVSGVFFAGEQQITRISENACISCADALVALLSRRDELGWVGSSVIAVRQGYRYAESASTTLRLTPVWHIETDTGSFEVSGLSGEVSPLIQ